MVPCSCMPSLPAGEKLKLVQRKISGLKGDPYGLSWGRLIETIREENVLCSNIWKLGRGYVEEDTGCLFLQAIRTRIKSDTMMGLIYHQHILFCAYIQQARLVISCIWGTTEACLKIFYSVHTFNKHVWSSPVSEAQQKLVWRRNCMYIFMSLQEKQ